MKAIEPTGSHRIEILQAPEVENLTQAREEMDKAVVSIWCKELAECIGVSRAWFCRPGPNRRLIRDGKRRYPIIVFPQKATRGI
jgi:hypothetical protein